MVHPFRKLVLILFLLMGALGADPSSASPPPTDELVALAKSGGKPVIADFGLGFCLQCKKQAATLEEIRKAYGDKVVLRMVNVNKEQALTSRYEVELIPTLVFFDAAGKVVLKKVGPIGYDDICKQLSRMGVK
jgi:thioredoxin 1